MTEDNNDIGIATLTEQYRGFLRNGVCTVTFTKVNGDTRVMKCTLNTSFMPDNQLPTPPDEQAEESANSLATGVIRVFDTEALGWRSFRVNSVTDFYVGV